MIHIHFKPFTVLLIFLLILLQYELWFQQGGIIQLFHLQKQITQQNEKNYQLQQRNDILIAKVQDIQRGNQVIEGYARENFAMVKKDETYYQVVDKYKLGQTTSNLKMDPANKSRDDD